MLHAIAMIAIIVIVIAALVDIWDVIVEGLMYIAMFAVFGYAIYSMIN